MQAVQEEAARSMMDAARDAILSQSVGSLANMSVEVRDDGGPVMRVTFSFEDRQKELRLSQLAAARRTTVADHVPASQGWGSITAGWVLA